MEDLKILLEAEQEKVAKLKALIVKERKVNTKMRSELERLKSRGSGNDLSSNETYEKVDKSTCTSQCSNVLNSTNTVKRLGFDVLPESPASNSDNIATVEQDTVLLQQFNMVMDSMKLYNMGRLSIDELKPVFNQCSIMLNEIEHYPNGSNGILLCSVPSDSDTVISENYGQRIQTNPNNQPHSSAEPFKKQEQSSNHITPFFCQYLQVSKYVQTETDTACDELLVLEERVDDLKSCVERAELSLNSLSSKITSAACINEMHDTRLCQLQATCAVSCDTSQSLLPSKSKDSLLYTSFLLPLAEYYQKVDNNMLYEVDVSNITSNNLEDIKKIGKDLERFLCNLKHIIKHYFAFNVNAVNGELITSDACISTENDKTNGLPDKILLDKLKVAEYEITKANEKVALSESMAAELKGQLQTSEEKLHRMKNLLVRVKLDAAEQQKRELQKSHSANMEYGEELSRLAEELSRTKIEKEDLESTVVKLSTELTQKSALCESLLHEKRLTMDRLQKLQTEHTSYKVKAQHALCNARALKNEVDSTSMDSNVGKSGQGDEAITINHPVESKTYFSNELELVKQNLFDVQRRMEEAELCTSLAQSECDLLKKELADFKARHSELLCQSQRQKQAWDEQILSLTQQHENRLHAEINKLEQKYTNQLRDCEERLVLQAEKYEDELRQERELWEAKLTRINHPTDLSTQNAEKGINVYSHRRNFSIPDQFTPLNMNPNHKRAQGDGADNTMITDREFQAKYDQAVGSNSLSHSGSDACSLVDEEASKNSSPRITIPTLEQLLNRHDQYISPESTYSPQNFVKSSQEVRCVQPNQSSGLQTALANQQRRVEYLSELLSESEANVARLFEQNKVLKEEIRRLENNWSNSMEIQETENQYRNQLNNWTNNNVPIEHLKSILLKVITLPKQSSERIHLMHALVTFLSLKSDECKLLEEGLNENVYSPSDVQQSSSSWSSYIPTVWRR
ncbi:unnamed protein product [Heterobilharzia americana]|nr:unnamed protein product [Heterobilharzia americana]